LPSFCGNRANRRCKSFWSSFPVVASDRAAEKVAVKSTRGRLAFYFAGYDAGGAQIWRISCAGGGGAGAVDATAGTLRRVEVKR